MSVPLVILTIGSIFSGFLLKDFFIGLGSDSFMDTIFPSITNNSFSAAEFLPLKYKLLPFIFSTLGLIVGFLVYSQKFMHLFLPIYNSLLNNKQGNAILRLIT